MITNYNAEVARSLASPMQPRTTDPTTISWSQSLDRLFFRQQPVSYEASELRTGLYRPFTKARVYVEKSLVHSTYRLRSVLPTQHHTNLLMGLISPRAGTAFGMVMTDALPDLSLFTYAALSYPRWTYERVDDAVQGGLLDAEGDVDEWGYRRVDNITDGILALYRGAFGEQVSKDDVFFYVYGVLHSPQYRTEFAADLKRMLPRIPLAATRQDFEAFTEAGRKLSDLHVNYEWVDPYPLHEQGVLAGDLWETYRVTKMRWADKTSKTALIVNQHVTLGDIPADAHRYMLGSRSAIEWLIDRYQVKTDKASGIVNDPNDWGREHGDPRYIVDLVKRVVRVSVDTMRIVDGLPKLPLGASA
jgi:predicted helicase